MPPQKPPPESAPSPKEAASSPAFAKASAPEGSAGFIDDAGPEFDAERAGEYQPEPEPLEEEPINLEFWQEEAIADLLRIKGRVLHAAAGVAQQDWAYTELDLEAIAPPLTRIANRYPAVRAYSVLADPLALASAFGAYATRSFLERKAELKAREQMVTEVPIAPVAEQPAPEGMTPSAPPPPPPPQRPSSMPAAPPPAPAPAARAPSQRPPRPGEAVDVGPDDVEWEIGG